MKISGHVFLATCFILAVTPLGAQSDSAAKPQKTAPVQGPPGADDYILTAESLVQPGVPQGTWEKYRWDKSAIFPATVREVWVYVPAQYHSDQSACLMVLQDGPR